MKLLKRFAYLLSTLAFSALSLLVYSPAAHANSFFGGNWKLTFYSPVTLGDTTKEVYTVNPDGTDLQRITSDSLEDSNPQWSPSTASRKIAFDKDDAGDGSDHNIYIQNIDSNGAASGSATVLSGANTSENEWDPSWNPDGDTIAFHRRSDVGGSGPNHIFIISASGGSVTALTGSSSTGSCDSTCDNATRDTEPTWNKDGDTLTFTRTDTGDDSTDIATVPATGDETDVQLIPGSDGGTSPQWSPLTNTIVFQKSGEIWTYTAGDSSAEQLTTSAPVAFAPTYSPDGKIIAASGGSGITYYNATTGAELDTVVIASNGSLNFDSAEGPQELDWARTSAPTNTEHDCTIYVNETCNDTDFDPQIPDICATGTNSDITTDAQHGTPSYSSGKFTYKPNKDYVGTDKYIYNYYDTYMNARTCTVNITVLPKAPDTGDAPSNRGGMFLGSTVAIGAVSTGYLVKRKKFLRR